MGYGQAYMSANEQAWHIAGKPFFSSNAATFADDIHWVVGDKTADWVANPDDDSATGYEGYRLVDGLPGRVSKPDSASTLFTVLLDFSSSPITFDWWGIMNHNLYTLACTECRLWIADNDAFSTNNLTLLSRNIATSYSEDRRIGDTTMRFDYYRFSDVPYARLGIQCSSGTPYIGQMIFGRRRQQKHAPSIPWDPTNETSTMYQLDSPGGVRKRTAKRKGRREIQATFTHEAGWPSLSGFTTFETDIGSFWSDIRCGKDPFYWMGDPTQQDDFVMFKADPAITYPHLNATSREFTIKGVEQGPQAQYFSQGP